ncbi:TetR/AcrR family transcriptional regulator [Kineococcus rhizosphaerae]|uniref:TetR family transcriptional regulator n=1 Tax=Kineococcus rhizosphaerae TaxID=559628 RepID=A0A2T0QYG6_9ACTN|nr:TetR/AcrR family transcriptional regulator [Kineococcus rhizosphaerae]PRY11409.1 TetR family transcriptional regulator [Kineococcus rhizosphaerae]
MTAEPIALRDHLIRVAADLLATQGASGFTTRAVAQAAGVQPPAIYRLFTDKDGLLDAVADHVMTRYVQGKSAREDLDPVEDLHAGWQTHVGFGVDNPVLFRILLERTTPAAWEGRQVLERRVQRVAEAGRLRVGEDLAVKLVAATGNGAVVTLSQLGPDDRLREALWEALAAAILTDVPAARDDSATVAFRASVPGMSALTLAERSLMVEWIDRALRGAARS